MYTVEERDAVREHLLKLATADDRIVAAAAVGSLALGQGDPFSDLDLTFGIADDFDVIEVLREWTGRLTEELGAVHLIDVERHPTTYGVFLLPGTLQVDLSMTPASRFAPAGPRFRLIFGQTPGSSAALTAKPPSAENLFGWAVIYSLHARASIERRRLWQAEHYVGAVRDYALSLACLRHELAAEQARGHDDLPADVLAGFEDTHVSALHTDVLRRALSASIAALLRHGEGLGIPTIGAVAQLLAELTSAES